MSGPQLNIIASILELPKIFSKEAVNCFCKKTPSYMFERVLIAVH